VCTTCFYVCRGRRRDVISSRPYGQPVPETRISTPRAPSLVLFANSRSAGLLGPLVLSVTEEFTGAGSELCSPQRRLLHGSMSPSEEQRSAAWSRVATQSFCKTLLT
jgi:hypothetical protein